MITRFSQSKMLLITLLTFFYFTIIGQVKIYKCTEVIPAYKVGADEITP